MSRGPNTNYTASGTDFEIATAADDNFEKEDVQKLAKAVDDHDHGATRGVAVARIGAGSATDTAIGNRTADQALASPATTGTLTQLLSWLAGAIKALSGATNWYDTPVNSIAGLLHTSTGHTHSGASNNGPQLTDAAIATANKDGAAGTASMRTLGTGAQQAAAGTHTHAADIDTASATLEDTTSSTSYATLDDMTAAVTTAASGRLLVLFSGSFKCNEATRHLDLAVTVDGGAEVLKAELDTGVADEWAPVSFVHLFTGLSAAEHTVRVRWKTTGATYTSNEDRYLYVEEKP